MYVLREIHTQKKVSIINQLKELFLMCSGCAKGGFFLFQKRKVYCFSYKRNIYFFYLGDLTI